MFVAAAHPIAARARKEGKKLFLNFCGANGELAHRAEAVHGLLGISLDWKKGPIRCDLKNPYIMKDIEVRSCP